MGNAANLRRNGTWATILDEMEARDQIVHGIPVVCPRHPDQINTISKAGELSLLAPGGGCLLPCGYRLVCGHLCPSAVSSFMLLVWYESGLGMLTFSRTFKCHVAVDSHSNTKCMERCTRTPCPRRHPCSKRCSDDCGNCEFPMFGVRLPCGHIKDRVPWCATSRFCLEDATDGTPSSWMMEQLASVQCHRPVQKQLPRCEHSVMVPCGVDPATVQCLMPCGGALACCSKTCKSTCSDCQRTTLGGKAITATTQIKRTQHRPHPCDRPLYCQHPCGSDCSQDHHCNTKCKHPCRQQCTHHKCPKSCSEPCTPCMEPCPWSCEHETCPVACGSVRGGSASH